MVHVFKHEYRSVDMARNSAIFRHRSNVREMLSRLGDLLHRSVRDKQTSKKNNKHWHNPRHDLISKRDSQKVRSTGFSSRTIPGIAEVDLESANNLFDECRDL